VPSSRPVWPFLLGAVTATAMAAWGVSRLPGVPYNVAKLIPPGGAGVLAATGLAFALWWVALGPFILFGARQRPWLLAFPAALALHGLAAFVVLRLSAPLEMVHKIIGTPVLDWPAPLEDVGRYLALHVALLTQLLGATLAVRALLRPTTLADFVYWAAFSLLLAWPLYYVVVAQACTDNLVELLRDQASFAATSAWASALFFMCLAGVALAACLAGAAYRRTLLALVGISAGLSGVLAWIGQEPTILKYGAVFSGLQFLLSADRAHYVSGAVLVTRLAVAVGGAVVLLALMQWPAWRRWMPSGAIGASGRARADSAAPGPTGLPDPPRGVGRSVNPPPFKNKGRRDRGRPVSGRRAQRAV